MPVNIIVVIIVNTGSGKLSLGEKLHWAPTLSKYHNQAVRMLCLINAILHKTGSIV